MKKTFTIFAIVILDVIVVGLAIFLINHYHFFQRPAVVAETKDVYYCPMHPNYTSDKPGECAICGMSLIKKPTAKVSETKESKGKILYYRNPMDPTVRSPVPMKDSMGMDYIPVYEQKAQAEQGFYISPEKQQLIGVKTAKIEVRQLKGQIETVANIAYDPSLYVAQQEYLQGLKSGKMIGESNQGTADMLVNTAKQKLIQMGMSEAEIAKLAQAGKPEQSLYLPEGEKIWVYPVIYEYQDKLVKTGQKIQIESAAYPGEIFEGKIVSIGPVIDPISRSLKVRSLVDNPENKLKLDMYVNAKIEYDLGEKLAVPEEAVLHAGTRDIVFTADTNGYFQSNEVTTGQKAGGYYEVLSGLRANQEVVTSGNFLVDSESKLNAVLSQSSQANK